MESSLLDLGSGDMTSDKPQSPELMKREQDSLDDFEHLDKDVKREDNFESTYHQQPEVARVMSQSFLDNERDLFVDAPRAPSADKLSDKLSDHLADKFTDSESDAAGESPIHRPPPLTHHDITLVDTTSIMKPAPAPQPPVIKPSTEPLIPESEPVKITREPTKIDPLPLKPEVAPLEPVKPVINIPEPLKPTPEVKAPAKTAPEVPKSPPAHVIEAEVIFCRMGLDAWFDPQRLHPKVESLVYWRDPVKSGIALGSGLALLVALACCSVVSVLAYVSLLLLTASVGFRIYKNVLQAVQKTNEGHPFKALLETDISVPAERAQNLAAAATAHLNATTNELRRLFLVEDLVDSLKFGVLLWCHTYIGAYFNGITLIILAWLALFTLPKAYEMNKAQVDANLEVARAKINEITNKVRAAVPIGRKSESEKEK